MHLSLSLARALSLNIYIMYTQGGTWMCLRLEGFWHRWCACIQAPFRFLFLDGTSKYWFPFVTRALMTHTHIHTHTHTLSHAHTHIFKYYIMWIYIDNIKIWHIFMYLGVNACSYCMRMCVCMRELSTSREQNTHTHKHTHTHTHTHTRVRPEQCWSWARALFMHTHE